MKTLVSIACAVLLVCAPAAFAQSDKHLERDNMMSANGKRAAAAAAKIIRANSSTGSRRALAVTEDEDVVLSGQAVASGVKPTEQSAAKRGFSPEVEKEYRKEHPNLDAAFKTLDDIVKGWVFPDDLILKFIEAGQLVPREGGSK